MKWFNLPAGETIQSTMLFGGRLVIISTSMVWYLDETWKLQPFEVVCPEQNPPSPAPTAQS